MFQFSSKNSVFLVLDYEAKRGLVRVFSIKNSFIGQLEDAGRQYYFYTSDDDPHFIPPTQVSFLKFSRRI